MFPYILLLTWLSLSRRLDKSCSDSAMSYKTLDSTRVHDTVESDSAVSLTLVELDSTVTMIPWSLTRRCHYCPGVRMIKMVETKMCLNPERNVENLWTVTLNWRNKSFKNCFNHFWLNGVNDTRKSDYSNHYFF